MSEHKKSHEMTVTVEMLHGVKDELAHRITTVDLKVDAVDKKVDSLRSEMNSKFEMVESKFEDIKAMLTKVLSKVEEIDNRNKFVLDGHAGITARQDRREAEIDERLSNVEDAIFSKDH